VICDEATLSVDTCRRCQRDSTASFFGDDAATFATRFNNVGAVRDMAAPADMSSKLMSSATECDCRSASSKAAVTCTNLWNSDSNVYSPSTVPLPPCQHTHCHSAGICELPDDVSEDASRTANMRGNVSVGGRLEVPVPSRCKQHSPSCVSSCLAKSRSPNCTEKHSGVKSASQHLQQSVCTDCWRPGRQSDVNSHCHSRHCTVTNELDITLQSHCGSSIDCAPTEVDGTVTTAATESLDDCSFVTFAKLDNALRTKEHRKGGEDSREICGQQSAEIKKERLSGLNMSNCDTADADLSARQSALRAKLPSLGRKSRKNAPQATIDKPSTSVATNNPQDYLNCNLGSSEHLSTDGLFNSESDMDLGVAANGSTRKSLHRDNPENLSTTRQLPAEQSKPCNADSAPTDKLGHGMKLRVETHLRSEVPSGVHHRNRSLRKGSRVGAKQRTARQDGHTTANLRLKQFLESIDWHRQRRNLGLFPSCSSYVADCWITGQFADRPTLSQSSRGLVNSWTSQLVKMLNRKYFGVNNCSKV